MSPSTTPPAQPSAPGEGDRDQDCFAQEGLPRRFGRYLLLRLIARGGMGQVFLASTTGVEGAERPVVIKVIRREHARDPNFLARFLDEARVQAQLQHSGVAQVLEAATHEPTDDPYVVLEFVEGRSLGCVRQRAAEVGLRLRWEDAIAVATQIADALAYVHERRDPSGKPLGIVHRDLSPHNVMISYSGELKIIDFGTARGHNRRCRTVAGVVFAKPGYVAPEVANGDSGDARVDLYAAGVMLWELCAGRRFLQGDAAEHLGAVARGDRELPPIAALVGAPAELDGVIRKLTAFNRDDRFASSRAAAAQLARLLAAATPLPNGERGVRARVAQLMYNLYPTEPGRSRRRFAKLIAGARECASAWDHPPSPEPAPAVEAALEPPGLLAGTHYRVLGELGRGASSVVVEAEHLELERRVAIKVLDAEHTHSKDFAARFRREARALSRLTHPGLVRVHDFGQSGDGKLYCVMELLEGETLRAALDRGERFDWRRTLRIGRRVALALQAAHDHGLVHRDIKPANLVLLGEDRVKIIDFSLAKTPEEVGDRPGDPMPSALEGAESAGALALFGTPEYMAPEQIDGEHVDGRADVYALGAVLYQLLTGRLPHASKTLPELLDAKLRRAVEPAHMRAPSAEIPRSVSRLVARALERDPAHRYQSALELADAIADLLDAPTRRRDKRRALGYAAFAALMAFAVVLLGRQLAAIVPDLPAMVEERLGTGGGGELPFGTPPAKALPRGRGFEPADRTRSLPGAPPSTPAELPVEQLELEDEPLPSPPEPAEPMRVRRDEGRGRTVTTDPVVLATDD